MHAPAEQDHDCVTLGRNEPEHEHILATAVVALRNGLPERAFAVKNDLLVLRADKVIDDVRRGGIAPGIAEPLGADEALHH